MSTVKVNDVEIEYQPELLGKIRKVLGKSEDEPVTEQEIVSFFRESFKTALDKGYGVVENTDEKVDFSQGLIGKIPDFS